MARSKKPYPGMGKYVLVLNYGKAWVAHGGANTPERARAMRRTLPQWRDDQVRIIENVPGVARP